MSRYARIVGYVCNGAMALVSALATIVSFSRADFGPMIIVALFCGISILNIYFVMKAGAATSEEEWLASEVRKAEMRRQLVAMAGQGLTDVVPPEVMERAAEQSAPQDQSKNLS